MNGLTLKAFAATAARAEALQSACKMVCQMHGLTIRFTGNLPAAPVIFVSNHLGYVDPIAICSLTPCVPIAKSEVAGWPGIGALSRRMNVIFVRRGDVASEARALRLAMRRLEDGVSVLNFPEGTTTRGDTLPFRRGVFGLSARMRIPVVPLAVSFDERELCWVDDESFLGHYSSTLFRRSHCVDIQAGPPMFILPRETPSEFAERVRSWIAGARSAERPASRWASSEAPAPRRSGSAASALASNSL
jgi:1-acyl-sn-glycerol-3-phosphate acyltransferase